MSALTVRVVKRSERINEVLAKKQAQVSAAVTRHTEAAANLMYQRAPVGEERGPDHVHMRDTIVIEQPGQPKQRIAIKKKTGKYWLWRLVEFGTRFMVAKPFVRPTLEAARRGLVADLQRLGFKKR